MGDSSDPFVERPWEGPPILAVILGDFGRAATVRFAAGLSEEERIYLVERLPAGTTFYDEHRRVSVAMHGDLRFVKERYVSAYLEAGEPFDDRILVGFPGGLTTEQVEDRMGIMALEAMSGAVRRGVRDLMVLIPCNTLAPVSWSLAGRFSFEEGIIEMLDEGGCGDRGDLRELAPLISRECRIVFPTVPEAVVERAHEAGASTLVPLGTERIVGIYEEAIERSEFDMTLAAVPKEDHAKVLRAITDAIDASPAAWEESRRALEEIERKMRRDAGEDVAVVSACTDLDYGVGIDSEREYAKYGVQLAYGK